MSRLAARLTVLFCLAAAAPAALAEEVTYPTTELWIESESGRHHFTVELAETNEQMKRGLMFRADLADDAGMMFDYKTPREIVMWMKNTLIPLDMVFVSPDGVVHRVAQWTTPLSLEAIPSHGIVRAVIELKGGMTQRLGITRGSKVVHEIFTTDEMSETPETPETPNLSAAPMH